MPVGMGLPEFGRFPRRPASVSSACCAGVIGSASPCINKIGLRMAPISSTGLAASMSQPNQCFTIHFVGGKSDCGKPGRDVQCRLDQWRELCEADCPQPGRRSGRRQRPRRYKRPRPLRCPALRFAQGGNHGSRANPPHQVRRAAPCARTRSGLARSARDPSDRSSTPRSLSC